MNQPSLQFGVESNVPARVGKTSRVIDTRSIAHAKVKPSKKNLHIRLVKDFYEREFNADQFALETGMSILSVRPRVSELSKHGLLMRTRYGLTLDGNAQNVYRLYPFYCTRLETLAAQIGMDAGAEALLAEVGLK